ncbi:MAG TPA: DUF1735 domain-containing protein [Phnomibacter sp.]|nr:DUF1735 domain-containing protein [Phnomibacter sp.]
MPTIKNISGCLIIVALMVSSCKKETDYDIKGDPEIKFFTNNGSLGNAPINSITYAVVNIPDGAAWKNLSTTMPSVIKFPVFATRPVSETVEIAAEVDNSLIAAYNAAHNTSFKELPGGILDAAALRAVISKGQTTSSDSISIPTDAGGLGGLTEPAYMVPVKLTRVSNPALGAITSNTLTQVTYIVLNTEFRRINYNANASAVSGTLASPRTGWTATFSPAPTTNGNIFDGNTNTFVRWGNSTTGQADIDLQQARNMGGIRLLTTTTAAQRPLSIAVWLSSDGNNYDQIGLLQRNDIAFVGGYEFLVFYQPITARYVRLVFTYGTSTNTQNRRINEFDIYAN